MFLKDDEAATGGEKVVFEAIGRGGLTEQRQLGKPTVVDDDRMSSTSIKSAKSGTDALRTIGQLQQQLA